MMDAKSSTNRMAKASIVGARGYLGRELVRLLLNHPRIESVVPASRSVAGQSVGAVLPALGHRTDVAFVDPDDAAVTDADVVFLATPGGEAARLAPALTEAGCTVVDLSRDHRLQALAGEAPWTYGWADVAPVPAGSTHVANPGCYPTAAVLALAPALQAGLVAAGPLIIDGKSGVSGAGVAPQPHLHYPEMNESVTAYKVLGHDHTHEIRAAATNLSGQDRPVRFTPHLVPQTRGLLATVYAPAADGVTAEDLEATYARAYAGSAFVRLAGEANTGHVRGGNFADVAVDLDPETGLLVARCAIDNLVKGGSGTAVQNMNTALGWDARLGLDAGPAPAAVVEVAA